MDGFSASRTTMEKLQPALFVEASVAVQVTWFVPAGKEEPAGGVQTMLVPEQLSVAVASKLTTALHWPGGAFVTIVAGQVIAGGMVSIASQPNVPPSGAVTGGILSGGIAPSRST